MLNVLRDLCREHVVNDKLIYRLASIAKGSPVKVVDGQPVGAEIRDQIRAIEILLDRGYGKAEQVIDLNVNEKRHSREEIESAIRNAKQIAERIDLVEYK